MNEVEKKGNVFSILALIFGLLGCIGAFIPIVTYVAWALGILGIVFGAIGMSKSKKTNSGHGLAVAGLVLGIIGTVVGLIGFLCIVVCVAVGSTL